MTWCTCLSLYYTAYSYPIDEGPDSQELAQQKQDVWPIMEACALDTEVVRLPLSHHRAHTQRH